MFADINCQLNLKLFSLFCPERPEAGEEAISQWRLDSALNSWEFWGCFVLGDSTRLLIQRERMSPRDTLSYRYHGGEPALSALLCSHLQELHLKAESLVVSLPPPPSPPFPLPPLLATPGIKAYLFWGRLFIVCAALPLIRTFDLAQFPLSLLTRARIQPDLAWGWGPWVKHSSFLLSCICVPFKKLHAPCSPWSLLLTRLCCTDMASKGERTVFKGSRV